MQLVSAYKESLAGLSMALQMTQQKASETAALRDLLGQALEQRERMQQGRDSRSDTSGSSSSSEATSKDRHVDAGSVEAVLEQGDVAGGITQRITQQQHVNITALAAGAHDAARGSSRYAAAAGVPNEAGPATAAATSGASEQEAYAAGAVGTAYGCSLAFM
jgi:hypothetical protein